MVKQRKTFGEQSRSAIWRQLIINKGKRRGRRELRRREKKKIVLRTKNRRVHKTAVTAVTINNMQRWQRQNMKNAKSK
jgi:hypothetical protein